MTFNIQNITLTCLNAGADTFNGDDLFAVINGNRYNVVNGQTGQNAFGGSGMHTGESGYVLDPGGSDFTYGVTLSFFDADGMAWEPFWWFEGGNDYINSIAPILPSGNFGHYSTDISGSGSKYHVEFDITRSSQTTGKIASDEGGVLNGKDIAGTLIGQGGKDTIYANGGDDLVVGRGNDDKLYGGKGFDLIFGGKGLDWVSGGAGKDTFVVTQKSGLDTIADFRLGTDTIGLTSGLEYEDLSLMWKTGGTLIKAGSEKLAFLDGVKPNQLGAQDFTQINLGDLHSRVEADMAALQA